MPCLRKAYLKQIFSQQELHTQLYPLEQIIHCYHFSPQASRFQFIHIKCCLELHTHIDAHMTNNARMTHDARCMHATTYTHAHMCACVPCAYLLVHFSKDAKRQQIINLTQYKLYRMNEFICYQDLIQIQLYLNSWIHTPFFPFQPA